MRRLAIVTARDSQELYGDREPLLEALAHVGIEGLTVPWGRLIDPDEFVGALIRTPWDYVEVRDDFVRWAHEVEALLPLANPAAMLEWNTDKAYLRELARADVPVVPTRWVQGDPDADPDAGAALSEIEWERFVVKPAISAGGRNSASYDRDDIDGARSHVRDITSSGGVAMVQPHVSSVDTDGEVGVYVVGGRVTHAVAKGGILPTGGGRVFDNSRAAAQESSRGEVTEELAAFARRTVAAVPKRLGDVLYARVDIVRDDTGGPMLIELELVEPYLFFEHSPEAAGPFAQAVDDWLHRVTR